MGVKAGPGPPVPAALKVAADQLASSVGQLPVQPAEGQQLHEDICSQQNASPQFPVATISGGYYTIKLDRTRDEKLGIRTGSRDGATLHIDTIFQDGLVAQW